MEATSELTMAPHATDTMVITIASSRSVKPLDDRPRKSGPSDWGRLPRALLFEVIILLTPESTPRQAVLESIALRSELVRGAGQIAPRRDARAGARGKPFAIATAEGPVLPAQEFT